MRGEEEEGDGSEGTAELESQKSALIERLIQCLLIPMSVTFVSD